MKRLLGIILTVAVITIAALCAVKPAHAASGTVSFTVKADKTSAAAGDTITFTITASSTGPVSGWEFSLAIPKGLSYVKDSGAVNSSLKTTLKADGDVSFTEGSKKFFANTSAAAGFSAITSKTVTVGSFKCKVDSNTAAGSYAVGLNIIEVDDETPAKYPSSQIKVTAAKVSVTVNATGITLDKTSVSMKLGGTTEKLTATLTPASANSAITFTSSNTGVVTVDSTGKLTAKGEGSAKITAKSGSVSASCTVTVSCDHSKLTHVAAKAATCTAAGNIDYYKCSSCSKCFKKSNATEPVSSVAIAALGHSWDSGTVKKEAFCTSAGEIKYTCKTCKATKTETVPATGHKWGDGVVEQEANCTQDGYTVYTCSVCDRTTVETVKGGHRLEHFPESGADCEMVGGPEHWTCSVCRKSFYDSGAVREIEDPDSVLIPATGHDWGEWQITKPASLFEEGEQTRFCNNNPEHNELEAVPVLVYELIQESGFDYSAGSRGSIVFSSSGSLDELSCVRIDGAKISQDAYVIDGTAWAISLESQAISKLSEGEHELCLEFENGEAFATVLGSFSVGEASLLMQILNNALWIFMGLAALELVIIIVLAVKLGKAKKAYRNDVFM